MEEELAFNAAMIDETHVRCRQVVACAPAANPPLTRRLQEDIQRISRNVVEVNAVFQNLAHMVDEQRADIGEGTLAPEQAQPPAPLTPTRWTDTIEGNMVSTEERVRSGLKHVDKAAEKQRAARAKMCALLVCLLVTAGVLLLIYRLTADPTPPSPPAPSRQASASVPSNADAAGPDWHGGAEDEGRRMAKRAASAAAEALHAARRRHLR